MKRLYLLDYADGEFSQVVVASSSKEAKKIGFNADYFEDVLWTDLRVKWKKVKDLDFNKLSYGIIENNNELEYLLMLGVFSSLYNWECPTCKSTDVNVYYDLDLGGFYCSVCEDCEK